MDKTTHPITLATILLLLVVPKIWASSFDAESPSISPTVFDILPKFGLPSGLLPDSVTNFTFSRNDGQFSVVLDGPCYLDLDYLLYYDNIITGKLSYGSITDLKGIQVRRFFIWFDVDEIRVDLPPSRNIYFQIGFVNKKLDIDQFQIVRTCTSAFLRSFMFNPTTLKLPTPTEELEIFLTE